MTDADWLEQITANPKDVSTQLAYADWLRDQHEDQLAHAWEWMARNGYLPYLDRSMQEGITWFNREKYPSRDPDNLPSYLFHALPDARSTREDYWKSYATVRDGVFALHKALYLMEIKYE